MHDYQQREPARQFQTFTPMVKRVPVARSILAAAPALWDILLTPPSRPRSYIRAIQAISRQLAQADPNTVVQSTVVQSTVDLNMLMDIIETVFDRPTISTFVLMTGDKDFTRISARLKLRLNKTVIVVGIPGTVSRDLVSSANQFVPLIPGGNPALSGQLVDNGYAPMSMTGNTGSMPAINPATSGLSGSAILRVLRPTRWMRWTHNFCNSWITLIGTGRGARLLAFLTLSAIPSIPKTASGAA